MLTTEYRNCFSFSWILALFCLIHAPVGMAAGEPIAGNKWINVGPALVKNSYYIGGDLTGRLVDMQVDPLNNQHWLITTAGGIWESTDAGTTWLPRTDMLNSLGGGYLSFSSNQTVYASTGSYKLVPGNVGGVSIGPLRSTNGGTTWQPMTTTPVSFVDNYVNGISADPANPNTVVMAVATGNGGLWKTTNATAEPSTWTKVLSGRSFSDLRVSPKNFNYQIAAVGEYWSWGAADAEKGVYRTLTGWEPNGSATGWEKLAGPWGDAGIGYITLAIAPSDPNVVYVGVTAAETGTVAGTRPAIWRVDNAFCPNPDCPTATPSYTQLPSNIQAYGWGPTVMSVDPSNKDVLFMGSEYLFRFDGATRQWNVLSTYALNTGIHVDNWSIAWVGQKLILGTDGGLYTTPDPLLTPFSWSDVPWQNINRDSLSTIQFGSGSLHPSNAGGMMGGTQDNGWLQRRRGEWQFFEGGDGGLNIYSKSDPDNYWVSAAGATSMGRRRRVADVAYDLYGSLIHTNVGVDSAALAVGETASNAVQQCPSDENVFIVGTNRVWKSSNVFATPDGVRPSWTPLWNAASPPLGYDAANTQVSVLAFAPTDTTCKTFAFGTSNGQVWLTKDDGVSWRRIQDTAHPIISRLVTDLDFNPKNGNTLYLALGEWWTIPTPRGYLYRVDNLDTASLVTDITPNLNGKIANYIKAISIDPYNAAMATTMYVATLNGSAGGVIWKSSNAQATSPTWTQYTPTDGLPNVSVNDLQVNEATGKLVAFTWGRGAFMLAPPVDLVSTAVGPSKIIPGASATLSDTVCNQGYNNVSASFNVNYYLSNDAAISSADTYLGTRVVSSLAANACNSGSTSWLVDANLPLGAGYYIGAIADGNSAITEGNENNNTLAQKALIKTNSDLVIVNLVVPASGVAAGSDINLSFRATNQGTGSTGQGSSANVLLNAPTGKTLLASIAIPALAAGGIYDVSLSAPLASTLGAARYYQIEVIVDESNQIWETNDTNNSTASALSISSGADLTVSKVTGPSIARLGEDIELSPISVTVCNTGTGTTLGYWRELYLSADAAITSADRYMGRIYFDGTHAGNNTCLTENTVTNGYSWAVIPTDLTPGNYYLGAIGDGGDQVPETNETNNALAGPQILVTTNSNSGIDLQVTSLSGPATWVARNSASLSDTVCNKGVNPSPSAVMSFYLSTDTSIVQGTDTLLGSRTVPALAASQCSGPISTVVNMPTNQGTGAYYWGGVIDPGNLIGESAESNNNQPGNAVTVSGPDLIVSALTAAVITGNKPLSIKDQVKNQGNTAVASTTTFNTAYYVSTDNLLSTTADNILVTNCARTFNGLAVNTANPLTATTETKCKFPATATRGNLYYVFAVVDSGNTVVESDETNNTKISTTQVKVP